MNMLQWIIRSQAPLWDEGSTTIPKGSTIIYLLETVQVSLFAIFVN